MRRSMIIVALLAGFISSRASGEVIQPVSIQISNTAYLASTILGKQHKHNSVVIEKLNNDSGVIGLILAAESQRYGDPEIITPAGTKEESFISRNTKSVSRKGDTLSILMMNSKQLQFQDWKVEASQDSDGDSVSYRYGGMIQNSRLHQVDMRSQHDSPSTYLVNAESGKIIHTHLGGDLVSISKDVQRLFVMGDGLNPPFGFFVSLLSSADNGIEIECYGAGNRETKIIPSFKGWYPKPHVGFDIVLLVGLEDKISYEAVPVRVMQEHGLWHVAVPNPQRFIQLTKMVCWQ